MSGSVLSAAQGGEPMKPYRYTGVSSPKGLGAVNSNSASQRTAWSNETNPYGTPSPLNKATSGSFYNWGDSGSSNSFKE